MSIFNELLPKINEIPKTYIKNFNDDLKAIYECFDKFEEEYQNGRGRAREKALKDKNLTTLQSINEDEDEGNKTPEFQLANDKSNSDAISISSQESNSDRPKRVSKKRSKNEVDGISSPEQDKRQKRNASVKAQTIITKQVNVNLTQKLRRDDSSDKNKGRKNKDDDKENAVPVPVVQIKQEKVSLPGETLELESVSLNIEVKQEVIIDEIAMPPPVAPVPKPRKGVPKEKPEQNVEEESSRSRRSTRTRKQADAAPAPVPKTRSTRASSRATKQVETEEVPPPPPESRPKRTRAKKKVSEGVNTENEKDSVQSSQESAPASPAEKPRPKRTRRGKAAEKEPVKPPEPETPIIFKEERISVPETVSSPILPQKEKTKSNLTKEAIKAKVDKPVDSSKDEFVTVNETDVQSNLQLDETRIIDKPNMTYDVEMYKTVDTPTEGQPNHMNETVVLEKCNRETMVLEKKQFMDETVVIDKATVIDPKDTMMTDDNSIITNDDSQEEFTPPKQHIPVAEPKSAVKEKVQQFEEMASRITRTKTRAMAKKDEEPETQTPPDKIMKPVLSAETLAKMNSMIFNGKAPQISSSASKPRTNLISSTKTMIPASTSKLSAIKAKEAEEYMKKEKEDARKKKEAMLEAKRELQKRKREEKMAAAAAAREAAEKERRAVLQAAARDRQEKQAHADQGKLERLREVERKKLELARKVAETEERRRAEEHARQQRLAEEQRRADAARRKQIEEAEATKKEAAIMAKEIEKRQKEYIEKQKKKHRLDNDKMHTPLKTPGTPGGYPMEPVYMADGFQYLNSDEEDEDNQPEMPVPVWSTSKVRKQFLHVQSRIAQSHVDRLFSVRVHTPDLRGIFPNIERARLKRTSSAVWRTPPTVRLPPLAE